MAKMSDFLSGRSGVSNFKASIDFLLDDRFILKILEGVYDNNGKISRVVSPNVRMKMLYEKYKREEELMYA